MLNIKEYCKVQSLKEAYELNQKKNNRIIAGGIWIKMGKRKLSTAIDLSGLGLNQIVETDTEFRIGCMTTIRDLEVHPGLANYTNGAMKESVRHIVGVQFRNCATVGGSIFGRFGFSDVLTLFLALDTTVELFHAGTLPLREFIHMPYDNDILVALHIKKKQIQICYQSERNTATDFPLIACAVSSYDGLLHVSVGARPMRAELFEKELGAYQSMTPDEIGKETALQFTYGNNRRAKADYRSHVAGVLIKRACQTVLG